MPKPIFSLLAIIIASSLQAQSLGLDWAISMGGHQGDYCTKMVTDNKGYLYLTGGFKDSADFDPSAGVHYLHSTSYSSSGYIQKIDSLGNLVWAKGLRPVSSINYTASAAFSIALDSLGNSYVAGQFSGTVDFDPGPLSYNLSTTRGAMYVLKLDTGGNFLWVRAIENRFNANISGTSMVTDDSGNTYITGVFFDTIDFDPGQGVFNLSAPTANDPFILKLNANGNFVWARSIHVQGDSRARSINLDSFGNVYSIGEFKSTADFDPGPQTLNITSSGFDDVYIQKLNSNGNLIWAKTFGGTGQDGCYQIEADKAGNIFVTGRFIGTLDFDPSPAVFNLSSTATSYYIQKLDGLGNFQWVRSLGGSNTSFIHSSQTDSAGNFLASVSFIGIQDLDPGPGVHNLGQPGGHFNFAIQKLDVNGNLIWANTPSNALFPFAGGCCGSSSIVIHRNEDIYLAGLLLNTSDFDPSTNNFYLTELGRGDIYLQKLNECITSSGNHVVTACVSYKWTDGKIYTTNDSTATDTLRNANGCDSIVTLKLTIVPVDTAISVADSILSARANSATYQWLDCANNYTPIIGATSQTYTAPGNGIYAVAITQNNCIDTSVCKVISTIGLPANTLNGSIHLFPNPTKGEVQVEFGSYKNISLKIFGIDGQLIYQKANILAPFHKFTIPGPSGFYIAEFSFLNGKKVYYKLIKDL